MGRLPDLLGPDDLAIAELHAAKLDGALIPVGDAFRPVDRPDGPEQRAEAAGRALPDRLIVCEESAAWVWLGGDAPTPVRVYSEPRRRTRPGPSGALLVREVPVPSPEAATVAGVAVTTPLRTACDLARAARRPSARAALHALLASGLVTAAEVETALCAPSRLIGRRAALCAVAAARARPPQPLETR